MSEISVRPKGPLREFVQKIAFVDCKFRAGTLTPLSPRPEPGISVMFPGSTSLANIDQSGRRQYPPPAMLVGPQSQRNFSIIGGGRFTGLNIMFQPTGFFRLFHQPLQEIRDQMFDACTVLGPEFRALVDAVQQPAPLTAKTALVERFLLSRVPDSRSASAVTRITTAGARSLGGGRAGSLTTSYGISVRQLERQFLEQVGMSPKRFELLVRFRYALRSQVGTGGGSWTSATHDAGYCDQSHLIKDFRRLTGFTPSEYLDAIAPIADAEMFD